jgi:hypothetical protein
MIGFYFSRHAGCFANPAMVEPWLLAFGASVEIHPVMIPADLAKAGTAIENAVKKYALGVREKN